MAAESRSLRHNIAKPLQKKTSVYWTNSDCTCFTVLYSLLPFCAYWTWPRCRRSIAPFNGQRDYQAISLKQPPRHWWWICTSPGNYEGLTPQVAFEFSTTPSVGQIALAFLQASFAFSGWNFLNYVTEEVVEPRRWASGSPNIIFPCILFYSVYQSNAVYWVCSLAVNAWKQALRSDAQLYVVMLYQWTYC